MASQVTEEQIIDKLAIHMATVSGIVTTYGFAQNPDQLHTGQLPASLFYPVSGEQSPLAHHNRWRNIINIRGMVYVTQRASAGNTLRVLENRALVFPQRLRSKFQEESVINDLLSLGLYEAYFTMWRYGAGGEFLTYANTEYIGFVLDWVFKEGR